jgi:hypothetical protein
MAALRGPGAVAPKRRPGTAEDIDGAPAPAIDKGFGRHGPRCTARLASFLEEEASWGSQDSTTTCNPLTRVGTANRLISDGMGFVEVSGGLSFSEGKVFPPRGEGFCFARSKLLIEDLQGLPVLF